MQTAAGTTERDGCGDVIFNGDFQLTGTGSRTLQVGQANTALTAGVVVGKMVFNGNILQTDSGASYQVTIANGNSDATSVVQLSGQNTYTGGTTISSPDISSGSNANIGLGSSTILDGGGNIISGPLGTGTLNIGSATIGNTTLVEALGGRRQLPMRLGCR